MAIEGVDYSWARPDPACLYRSGFRFTVRYVSYSTTGKSMTAAEVKKLTAAGLSMVTVWQQGAQDALGGFDRGAQYARDADRMHRAAGGPSSAPIYFAVDFDAGDHQLSACYAYLRGAASVLGWARVGVYGSVRVIRYMADKGVRWLWQTYAWSGGQWDSRAQLRQWKNGVTRCGGTVDLTDATTDDYGQWPRDEEDDMPSAKEIVDELLDTTIGDPFQVDKDGKRKPVRVSVSIAWRLGRIPHIYAQNEALQRATKANAAAIAALTKLVTDHASDDDGSELVAAARELTEAADKLANLPLATALVLQEEDDDEEGTTP